MGARIWALVIDPMHARIVPDFDGADGEEPTEFTSHASAAHLRAIMTGEVAGTTPDGPLDDTAIDQDVADDALRQDMTDFVQDVMTFLEIRRRADRFDRLAVFADPSILPFVRMGLSAPMRAKAILQPARRLSALPAATLRERLRDMIGDEKTQSGPTPRIKGSE